MKYVSDHFPLILRTWKVTSEHLIWYARNPNSIILLASREGNPCIPTAFLHSFEYTDALHVARNGYKTAVQPFILDDYPEAREYYLTNCKDKIKV